MEILKKDPNKVKVKTKTDEYSENLNSKLTWKNKVDLEMDNILNDYNLAEVLAAETEELKQTYK